MVVQQQRCDDRGLNPDEPLLDVIPYSLQDVSYLQN